MTRRRRLLGGAVALVAVLAVALLLLPERSNGALEVADSFAVPAEWPLLRENVEPPRFLCLGGNPCPSVNRQWAAPRDLSTEDITALVTGSGWSLALEGSCEPRANGAATFRSCSAAGRLDGFAVSVTYRSPEDPADPAVLGLDVR